jgi:hypothetical protein
MISPEHRLLLLKLIRFDGNVQPLIDLNYDFTEVVSAIKKEVSFDNAKYEKGILKITQKGEMEIQRLEKQMGREFPWIEPEIKSRIEPLKKNEIYIPLRQSMGHLFEDF